MDKMLKVALMLTAIDKMSGVVNQATGKALQDIDKVESGMQKMRDGFLLMGAGKQGFNILEGATNAFGKTEAAGNRLKVSMMRDGGILDEKIYDKMIGKAQALSEKYANTSEAYLDMFRVLKNNGMTEKDIMGQIGEANEMLAVALDVAPSKAAEFVSHMKRDMGVANKDMMGMMDLIARMHSIGVGVDGSATVNEMNQFFSKEGLSASIMKSIGLEEAKSVSAIAGLFIRRGLSGQTVGTNFRRMLDTMRNPKAMKAVNDEAAKFGITLDLFDKKTHQFKGFSNMISQFDKLRGLDVQTIDKITHAFGGRQGLSNDFIALLSTEGVKDFNEVMKDMYKQANIMDKVNVLTSGQEYQIKRMSAAWFNFKANVGATIAPAFVTVISFLTRTAQAMSRFAVAHPIITRVIVSLIAFASTVIMVAGGLKILKGAMMLIDMFLGITKSIQFLVAAYRTWRIANAMLIASNTALGISSVATAAMTIAAWMAAIGIFVLIGLVVYGVVKIIQKHWGAIAKWFSDTWKTVKKAFMDFAAFLFKWTVALNPVVLIFTHWDKVKKFFVDLWANVKTSIMKFLQWILFGLPTKMYEGGKNLVSSLGKGIGDYMHKVVDKVKNLAQKIRNFFPFSPAKDGPLRDIHKVKLIETIASAIRPDAILDKMKSVASAIFDYKPNQTAQSIAGGSGGVGGGQIIIAPVFHYHAAAGAAGAGNTNEMKDWFQRNSKTMVDMLQEELRKRNRGIYN